MSKEVQQNKEAKIFANNIKMLRLKKGWSASELARQADMGRDNICCYEKGKSLPNSLHLSKLANALNIDPTLLISTPIETLNVINTVNDEKLELKQITEKPGFVKLIINKELPLEKALEILNILQKNHIK